MLTPCAARASAAAVAEQWDRQGHGAGQAGTWPLPLAVTELCPPHVALTSPLTPDVRLTGRPSAAEPVPQQ